jgi:phosphoglycerate dehydrogenase-like enzyme
MTAPLTVRRVLYLQQPRVVDDQRDQVEVALRAAIAGCEVVCAGALEDLEQGAAFDAVIAPTLPWLPDALARVQGVRWVHFLSAGVERIWDMDVAWDRYVVTKSSGVHGAPMSELVFGAMLYFRKRLGMYRDQQRERVWRREWLGELCGRTVVIFGLGAVGQAVARRAAAFDMRVLGVSRGGQPVEHVERVVPLADRARVLGKADFVVLCLPLTAETRGLVDAAFLAALPAGAVLVDVSRGGVVREADLVTALRDGRLAAAALDVFEREPLDPGSPLWDLPNVLITPHVGGTTPRYLERALEIFVRNWESLRAGRGAVTGVDSVARY